MTHGVFFYTCYDLFIDVKETCFVDLDRVAVFLCAASELIIVAGGNVYFLDTEGRTLCEIAYRKTCAAMEYQRNIKFC